MRNPLAVADDHAETQDLELVRQAQAGDREALAPDTTYFDPTLAKRIDGIAPLHALIDPLNGKLRIERSEMIDPKVQQQGDIAVLTFNLVSHGAQLGDGPKGDVRWNSTEVYQRTSGQWKIIHSHWSYTQPELKQKPAE